MSFDPTTPVTADLNASVEANAAPEPSTNPAELRVLRLKVKTSLRAGIGDVRNQWPY